ncbi:MAG: V-type ATPase subunit [Planctomycetota bacterium]|jgi:V/A-type H+-transporting ATPase subunit C
MNELAEQLLLDFHLYPSVGDDDWRYTFAAAEVRALETQMLTRPMLLDMVNAETFEQAVDLLAGTEYAMGQAKKDFSEVENILKNQRSVVRALFTDLMIDEPLVELLREKDDFANLRLALRRKLTDKPLGTDYSNQGSVPAEQFEEIFEQENYTPLPFYMQQAIERAVLAYYPNKDIRQIDYALDTVQAEYKLQRAKQLQSLFLVGLFRMQIDLTNIRTMLRLRFTESPQRGVFLPGGYLTWDLLKHGLDVADEAITPLFFATPYADVVESGVNYFVANKSFLRLERNCQEHLIGYLKTTSQITAGPQPVIAYLLMKEHEIRTVRLILTAKKNLLDKKLILDRLGE